MWLAIDGYNVIAVLTGEPLARLDLEAEREEFNQLLISYRKISKNRLTVVYDGGRVFSGEPRNYSESGVKINFSTAGQSADQVLIRMAHQFGSGLTVVSSDREVARESENFGAVVLDSGEFVQRLLLELSDDESLEGEEESVKSQRHLTRKKGNPNRLSKKERRRSRRLQSM
ncbi:MAG: NYN domain-containing protein [Deltaproteobacteria bacterium]|nr:NYN domain-containing protein [Deltaproteobacteria bacterium]